ncbi:Release factor glutamine methyltransferase [Pelagimonas phthalicica]|uniref:Release factor glutamine methyltransferase n=1 Tax=Pelagimonas phthalicica TaxID=1037362 RepID=A0A238JD39_9RHOB|nr:peptide chain release factor N(5)-glutamine methyltransferase [Pelagimonas phthalicica]TDS91582.1 release factor glutamine methyltransferase [Pelagimonas phthalicica]SMX28631.1 Release factor glutamine methyltransferase [Pelagimonas phthalicica]
MRASELLVQAARRLNGAGIPDANRDARKLLAFALQIDPSRLTLVLPDDVSDDQAEAFHGLIERRAAREPVSHLTGTRLFYGRNFRVSPKALDPRPETESLIEAALVQPFSQVLDLGTGTGCILLTLLAERTEASGVGVDLSDEALEVAKANRDALQLAQRAELHQGSWFDAVPANCPPFDLIVSNPPYIALSEMADLEPEVREYEPRLALTDEGDGLQAYRDILANVQAFLAPGGRVMVEIGPTQASDVTKLMQQAGLAGVETIPDMDGRDRVVLGRKSTE